MNGYLDAPCPLAFAHRGGAAAGDENTVDAFARAIALGFRYLETDVRATADGVAVVFHDADLARLAGQADRVDTLRYADLATVRIRGEAVVPRLADVLDAWQDVRFNIDVKAHAAVDPTVAVIRRLRAYERVLLASFSDARIARLRRALGPRVATALATGEVARLRLASYGYRPGGPLAEPGTVALPGSSGEFGGQRWTAASDGSRGGRFAAAGVVAAQVPVRLGGIRVVDRRLVALAHRLGLQVHVWTVDEPAEMHALLDLGVDGIMSDHPKVLREVYLARGVWRPTDDRHPRVHCGAAAGQYPP